MERRQFINGLVASAAAAGLGGPAITVGDSVVQADDDPSPSVAAEGTPGNASARLPRDIDAEVFGRLYPTIETMEGFNNHLHQGDERVSLDWFYPREIVGRNAVRSRGLSTGLAELLGITVEQLADETLVRARYDTLCHAGELRDFYHRLGDLTHDQTICFITEPGDPANERLHSARLKLIVHTDQFLFPYEPASEQLAHPNHRIRFGVRRRSLEQMYGLLGVRPAGFDQYLEFVTRAIAHTRATSGVIGAKWGFSYYRSLDVALDVTRAEAQRIYEQRDSSPVAYKRLQDFLALYTLRAMADEGLPLQIHTGLGADPGLALDDTRPCLVDRLLAHPDIQHARICLLHGGYPYCGETGVMMGRRNVWLDFSWMVLLLPPTTLADYLKQWIELRGTSKLLYGVDGCGMAQIKGAWTARRALALALSRMVQEDQLDEREALGGAQGILRDNAKQFYRLNG